MRRSPTSNGTATTALAIREAREREREDGYQSGFEAADIANGEEIPRLNVVIRTQDVTITGLGL